MTNNEILLIIRELVAAVSVLLGIGVTFITARSASREARAKSVLEKEKHSAEKERQEVELTERLQKLSSDLMEQMELRIKVFQDNILSLEAQLDRSHKKAELLRKAGLRLIHGIEASIQARSQVNLSGNPKPETCAACFAGDQALLAEVKQVKILFEEEKL